MSALPIVAKAAGWIYTLAWGIGFYPPLLTNIKLWSIQGLSMDFIYFNHFGYVLYTIYYGMLRFNSCVRQQYSDRYTLPSDPSPRMPLIKTNDFLFALHGLCVQSVLISQAYWWGFAKNDNQIVSKTCKRAISSVVLYGVGMGLYVYHTGGDNPIGWEWLDLFTSLGLLKIAMSVCKNIPQIYYNYKRKSTHGWPIVMIWLDCVGAVLSLTQLVIDAIEVGDLKSVFNNLPKFLLSVEASLADIVFFLQHYYWYYNADVQRYGDYKAGLAEDEQFLEEHRHDHDHLLENEETGTSQEQVCSVKSTDEGEMQRLLI
ncbi:unnamed protein product [Kuraishia capsulata CBS 1993]|uniref:Cystinosin n=1 Tax=Kuraishia capsulata CBS 1993 TaxID=1382522 RepID=W6MW17_9ASCO|nr:uncharacterized protein KUCA_T00002759001 [Kuraishia capsulata CBS 1993]CDK26785.1 unnamed protein product [Kuraishia capsulata CBS 1993]